MIDDEIELRELIVRFLAREGYVVRCAEVDSGSGPTGDRVPAHTHSWSIGCWSHGHDGADAMRAVRQVIPDVKAIVMSGLPPEQVRHRLDDLEVLEVLEKPFQVGVLFEQIQRALA